MYSLRIPPQPPMDAGWYQKLRAVMRGNKEVFVLLEPTQEELLARRQAFNDSAYTYCPDLRPVQLDIAAIQLINAALRDLNAEIQAYEPHPTVKAAYHDRITELLTGNEMVLAAAAADDAAFAAANQHLYGTPNAAIYAACCAWIRANAEQTQVDGSALAAAQGDVLRLIPAHGDADSQILIPSETVFHKVKQLHSASGGCFDQLFAPGGLPADAYIEQETGDAFCEQVIANIGSDYTVGDSADGIWAVLQSVKQVIRPPGYRIDRAEFGGIVSHEIGSHLLEAANGSRQPLRLLESGLAHFESGNEGRAYLREQIMYQSEAMFTQQSSWEYILMLYLGVCLGSGSAGEPYNFAQLYEVLYALHIFWRGRRFPMVADNELSAREEAWHLTVRIMKGTGADNTIAGCYKKDIVYLKGNLACWRAAARDPEIILFGDSGKFDITNPRHMEIIRNLSDSA